MNLPVKQQVLSEILREMDIADISRTTIRQGVAVANALEKVSGEKFVHLEIGVPGLPACQIGIDAQKAALDRGVAAIYPAIGGIPELKENASRFIKAFVNQDIPGECIVPTVGSMQGCNNLILECSQMQDGKDTILYINPGFAPHMLQAKIAGAKIEAFDIYDFRADKLHDKLESYMSKGNIAAMVYSNPNNPAWVCLTDDELKTIGELATKYDVVVLEDMAYMCMDFRSDKSPPYEAPFQPTVSRYTDNYVMMMSGSKIFSYAGERIALVAFSPKLYHRDYPRLRELYGMGRMGDNFVLTYLYAASSGTSHSAQCALAAMMGAAADGYDFVHDLHEYEKRAHQSKEIFLRHGFEIVYDKDLDQAVADGFFYTVGYHGMDCEKLLSLLMRCGIAAITLNTTGSERPGARISVSALKTQELMQQLDERLAMFEQLANEN